MFSVYMILLTAFAIFGFYCFLETLLILAEGAKSPPSVVIIPYGEDHCTYKKVRYVQNNLSNNTVLFIDDFSRKNIYPDTRKCKEVYLGQTVREILEKERKVTYSKRENKR